MNLDPRVRILVEKITDSPRLGAGQILADDAPRREVDRILGGYRIAALAPLGDDEMMLAVRMERPAIFEQTRRARMVEGRAGPKHAHVLVNLFVSNAIVVRVSAARCFPQFFVNLWC